MKSEHEVSTYAPGITIIYSLFNLREENSIAKLIGKYMTRMFTNTEMAFILRLPGLDTKAGEGTSR